MKKLIIVLLVILPGISLFETRGQGTGFVTLKGKQFYDENDDPFFPIVCNYKARIFYRHPDPTEILSPEHHYGASGEMECIDQPACITQMTNDFLEMANIGFNAVRMAWTSCLYKNSLDRIDYEVNRHDNWDPAYIHYISIYPPYDYANNQQAYDKIFSFYDAVHQAAVAADLKVIWLINGNGVESDDANLASAAVDQVIAYHCRNYSNTLAYDLCNEPKPAGGYYDYSKSWFCEKISSMYNAIKDQTSGDPNHLVTLGGYGPEMVCYFDVNCMNVDFFSAHAYIPVLPNSITYSQNDKANMVLDYFYWLSQVSNKPFIIGEAGFRADPAKPIEFTDGNILDQYNFAQKVMEMSVNCGFSGYSWWAFQDEFDIPFRNPYGVFYAGLPYNPKPIAAYFSNLDITTINGTCNKPDNYDSNIGPLLIPENAQTIHGVVTVNGIPQKDVVIESFNKHFDNQNDVIGYYVNNCAFTNENGEFTISPIPSNNLINEGPIINLKISTAASSRLFVGEFWNTQVVDNPFQPYELTNINFKYDLNLEGMAIAQDNIFQSWNKLNVSDVSVGAPYNVDFTARNEINITGEFFAENGSDVHLFTSETFFDCFNIPFRIKNNSLVNVDSTFSNSSGSLKNMYINFLTPENHFNLFPNPCKDHCQLTYIGNDNQDFDVYLFDQLGRLIESFKLSDEKLIMNFSNYSAGPYQLRITDNKICKNLLLIHN